MAEKIKALTDYRRYYCHIRVDSTFNAGNLPLQNIGELNERLLDVLCAWADEMGKKGLHTDIGLNWSEHTNI